MSKKIIINNDNDDQKEYHKEQIKMIEEQERLLIKQKNDARVLEIHNKYPVLYVIEEHVSGYVDYVSSKACFINEQLAESALGTYTAFSTSRFTSELVIRERLTKSLSDDLLLNMD
jgi:hypothetical protein